MIDIFHTPVPATCIAPTDPSLQSGGLASAHLHHARTVCRRAERLLVVLVRDGDLKSEVAVYVNRLSDYLFVAARYAALKSDAVEQIYAKAKGLKERQMAEAAAEAAAKEAERKEKAAAKQRKGGSSVSLDGREDDDRSSVSSSGSGGSSDNEQAPPASSGNGTSGGTSPRSPSAGDR